MNAHYTPDRTMTERYDTVIAAYKRLRTAYRAGAGVRLSADEVAAIWLTDDAVSQAVRSAEEREAEERADMLMRGNPPGLL